MDLKSGGRDVTRLEMYTSGNSVTTNKQTADFLFQSVDLQEVLFITTMNYFKL